MNGKQIAHALGYQQMNERNRLKELVNDARFFRKDRPGCLDAVLPALGAVLPAAGFCCFTEKFGGRGLRKSAASLLLFPDAPSSLPHLGSPPARLLSLAHPNLTDPKFPLRHSAILLARARASGGGPLGMIVRIGPRTSGWGELLPEHELGPLAQLPVIVRGRPGLARSIDLRRVPVGPGIGERAHAPAAGGRRRKGLAVEGIGFFGVCVSGLRWLGARSVGRGAFPVRAGAGSRSRKRKCWTRTIAGSSGPASCESRGRGSASWRPRRKILRAIRKQGRRAMIIGVPRRSKRRSIASACFPPASISS